MTCLKKCQEWTKEVMCNEIGTVCTTFKNLADNTQPAK